jgi:hypothetical protein
MIERLRAATALALIAAASGCSGPRAPADPDLGEVPEDFSLDVIVLAGHDPQSPPDDPARRTSRYLVQVDWSLRWSVDPRGLPAWRRSLRWGDMSALWSLVGDLDLGDPLNADPPINVKLIEREPGELIYVASVTGARDAWQFVRRCGPGQEPDPALARLVRRLSALAWADAPALPPTAPRRYDFGPDPYAGYRR